MKKIVVLIVAMFVVLTASYTVSKAVEKNETVVKVEKKAESVQKTVASKQEDVAKTSVKTETPEPQPEPKPIDWRQPSGGEYPVLKPQETIWIHVSKANQKVYIMDGDNVIYTMICSTGMDSNPDSSTPEGTFYVQQERGLSFYNGSEKMGAKYWVSWKDHGVFLFHSVPTDINGNIIPSEADKLGEKASHGCVRLTMPDAKWVYDTIQTGTKVVID